MTARHGNGTAGVQWNGSLQGEVGDSAIKIGSFVSGSTINIKIANGVKICAGGGGGSGGVVRDWTGGSGDSSFSNGSGGSSDGGGGYGGACGQGGGAGGVFWSDRGYYLGGNAANNRLGAPQTINSMGWGSGSGGNGGCAIEIPSSSLNGVTINIVNNGIIAGATYNQLLGWDFADIWYNGKGFCYK